MNKNIVGGLAVAATAAWLGFTIPVAAQRATFPDPNAGLAPEIAGEVGPLIPMQSTEAVHMGLVWKADSNTPKVLFHSRFPEFRGTDMADPELTDLAISGGAFTTPGLQFNASLRDVLHGFDPFLGLGMDRDADDSFQRLTYGGYLMRQGLSQSVPTRILVNRGMERQLLFDLGHPHAFKTSGKLHTSLLDENDFLANLAAFSENGYSKGMFYNTYCNARVTLADGRVYVFGGHDMQSNNGLYKVNIFDPETEEWVPRREPCFRSMWEQDRFGENLFGEDADAMFYPGCDPRDQQSTQPSEPSDQKYARWYPSAVPLPNNWVLVIGGHDQDNTVPPDPDRVEKGRQNISQTDTAFGASRVNIVVPELYDPVTDRNIALENARMAFPLYPQADVVQTGPGVDDWMVCTFNGTQDFGAEPIPGGAAFFGPWQPTTWCLDVAAAMRDPNRDVPGKNHWRQLDSADIARPYCCPTASLVTIDANGSTTSHRWFHIGGATASIQRIEFTEANPQWAEAAQMPYALSTRKAVLLPDGKVLLGHGANRGLPSVGDPALDFERREGLRFHMFDPIAGTVTPLGRTTVSRGLHGTATLLPDATVLFAGENREALVRTNDPSFPLNTTYAGALPAGDGDQAVPVGQIVSPPYLFQTGGSRSSRPQIVRAPKEVGYGGHFDLRIAGRAAEVASVALLRSDHNTHSLTAGDRYVRLSFEASGGAAGDVQVRLPNLPAQAVPGVYMLYVVDQKGVPSVGQQIRLMPPASGLAFR